jgi:hydrogenase-4 component F
MVALVIAALALPIVAGLAALVPRSPSMVDRIGRAGGALAGLVAGALGVLAIARGDDVALGSWWRVDAASGLFILVIAVVGLLTCLVSPAHLRQTGSSRAGALGSRRAYWIELHAFWSALLAIPVVDNLGLAWILVAATTAASALLVAHSGKRSALEAGWKYLVLTSMGLTVALFGIVVLYASAATGEGRLSALDWSALEGASHGLGGEAPLVAFVLVTVGLATKAGWAPVHNWLPDAHSEAPPPVSALLSAALLPTVALVAWRLAVALRPAVGAGAVTVVFVGFGLASLAVAIPFLWRSLPWKRLLAYSSLEHMGVIALAIGFQHPLATAGALLHVAGHAIAKSLGFYASIPLLRYQPAAGRRAPRGLARVSSALAGAVGVSLAALAGLPPAPLFISEILVLLGGIAAGHIWAAALAAILLALGFLGLAHVLVEGLAGRPTGRRPSGRRSVLQIAGLTAVSGAALLGLTVVAYLLPDSAIVRALAVAAP